MPLDRMPSISLGIIVHVGTGYDASYHWRTDAGELRASVGSTSVATATPTSKAHRPPCASWPPPWLPPPTGPRAPTIPPMALAWWWRGWRADVGRQPRLPGLRIRLAHPLPLA